MRRRLRSRLLLRIAVLALGAFLLVDARAQPLTSSLPPQRLADALESFAKMTGYQLVYRADIATGLKTKGAAAGLTADETLRQLLRDTGLSFAFINDRTVAIYKLSDGRPRTHGARDPTTQTNSPGVNDNDDATRALPGGATKDEGSQSVIHKSLFRRIVGAISVAIASIASAADGSQAAAGNPQAVEQLQEIVVTAQKREERLLDVPIPVTAITAASLASSNQLRLQDYYTRVPGLSVVGGDSASSNQTLSIRGITTGRATNPTVGITVDDVPYGSSTNLGGGNAVPDIDPGDLARIEVLRGPQGALYGVSSMGGVLKFVTVDPSTSAFSGRVQAQISSVRNGSDPGYNVRGALNVPVSESFAIRASGFTRQDPGYIDNPVTGEEGLNEQRVRGGYLAALWRLPQSFSLKLTALYQQFEADGVSDVTPALGDLKQSYIRGVGPNDGKVQSYGATLTGSLGNVAITSVTGYSRRQAHISQDFTFAYGQAAQSLFGAGGADLITDNRVGKFSQEVRLSGQIGPRFDWIFGGFYTNESSTPSQDILARNLASGAVVADGYHADTPSTYREYAAFADLTIHVTDRFDVQIGGRRSRITQSFDSSTVQPLFSNGSTAVSVSPTTRARAEPFTYLFTPSFKLSPDLMVYARMASGYRAGGANAQLCVANDFPCQYEPDKTLNYELGMKGDFLDDRLVLDGSVYYIDWKNIQVRGKTGQFSYNTNAGRAKSQGVELSLEAKPIERLTVTASGAWNDAELTEDLPAATPGVSGDRVPYTSRFSGSLSIEQTFPVAKTEADWGATVSYVGDRLGGFTVPRARFPGYSRTDVHAGVRLDAWNVNAFVNNVFDKRGLLQGGVDLSPIAYIYIQPRTYGVSVERSF